MTLKVLKKLILVKNQTSFNQEQTLYNSEHENKVNIQYFQVLLHSFSYFLVFLVPLLKFDLFILLIKANKPGHAYLHSLSPLLEYCLLNQNLSISNQGASFFS